MRGCAGLLVGLVGLGCGGPRGQAVAVTPVVATAPPPVTVEPPRAAPISPLSYLDDDFARLYPLRVRLARRGEVRFAAGDADPQVRLTRHRRPLDAADSPSLVVVDRVGDRFRVVTQEESLRLLLWIESADLYSVVTASSSLALEPDERAAPQGGRVGRVHLGPGAPLHVQEERDAVARVSFADACVSAEGWMRRDRLGREYLPVDEASPVERDRSVHGGTDVLDRPGGVRIARFHSDCDVLSSGAEVEGMTPILYEASGVLVRGWVATAAAAAHGGAMGGLYGGLMGSWRSTERFHVTAGACVYAERGGEVIGLVTEDSDESSANDEGNAWWRLTVETEWGVLPVWVVEDGPATEEVVEEPWGGARKVITRALKQCR